MPNAQKITSRILEEAKKAAENIVAEAKAEANENLAAAKKEANEILKQADREASVLAGEQGKHKLSAIESELRKEVLSVRRKLIDSAFAKAMDKLVAMSPEAKVAMLAPRIMEASPDGQGEILMAGSDVTVVGPQLLEAVQKLYEAQGIKPQLIISQDTIKASGGFVLRKGNIEYNNTYETLLKSSQEELEGQVAAIIFADEISGQG